MSAISNTMSATTVVAVNGTNGNTSHGKGREALHVIDDRTGKYYQIPIFHNAINANEFKKIKAPENVHFYADQNESGIRVFDPGFTNTAVVESKITYMFVPHEDRDNKIPDDF